MAIGGVVINFVAKTKDAVTDVKKLSGALGDVKDGTTKAGGGIKGFASKLGGALPVAGAIVGAITGAAVALGDMAKAAWEDKQQADKLANTLRNIPGITEEMIQSNEDWITSMQLATLVSDTDLRTAIGNLTLATGDLTEAQNLATIAADAAAGSGKSYTTITDAMAKAASGNTTQLERMFPWLDKNNDGTVTLTEAQKGLKGAFKGAADQAAKNDPWKRIGIIWDELKETVGTALVPVLEELSDWFSNPKNQQKIQDFMDKVAELAEQVGDDLVYALKDLIDWLKKPENQQKLKDWAGYVADIAEAIAVTVEAIGNLIEWLNKIPKANTSGGRYNVPGGIGPKSAPGGPSAVGYSATPPAMVAPTPPTVIVTEEQVYRAVQQLMLRGQGRNGRLVVVG